MIQWQTLPRGHLSGRSSCGGRYSVVPGPEGWRLFAWGVGPDLWSGESESWQPRGDWPSEDGAKRAASKLDRRAAASAMQAQASLF